jgi:hypothetical protein
MGDPVELSFDGVGCSAAASSMRTGLGGISAVSSLSSTSLVSLMSCLADFPA